MVQGMLHRAGVVIVLIAALLLPYGRCQSPGRAASHECCVQGAAADASVKANCCIVRTELPAVIVERAVPGPSLAPIAASYVSAAEPAMIVESGATTPVAHHYPPPGASVLRI